MFINLNLFFFSKSLIGSVHNLVFKTIYSFNQCDCLNSISLCTFFDIKTCFNVCYNNLIWPVLLLLFSKVHISFIYVPRWIFIPVYWYWHPHSSAQKKKYTFLYTAIFCYRLFFFLLTLSVKLIFKYGNILDPL